MYKQRLHAFIIFCIAAVSVCIIRLGYLQFFGSEEARERIKDSRILSPYQLPTVRGKIVDRKGNVLAKDNPVFYLKVNYQLTKLLDDRFWQASISSRINEDTTADQAQQELRKEYKDDLNHLISVIEKCVRMKDVDPGMIEEVIRQINDEQWNDRQYQAWARNFPESPLSLRRKAENRSIFQSEAIAEFERLEPDINKRQAMIMKVDLKEMYDSYPLIELKTEDDLLTAQLEFVDIDGVEILPDSKRVYPYESSACHIIGWVGHPLDTDKEMFADDKYSSYLPNEVSGNLDGVERACEAILRGKRGEKQYDKDGRLLGHKETIFGQDVRLSIDVEMQYAVEQLMSDPARNPNSESPCGVVVMDVATGDILAMVSTPVYDLNTARKNYNELLADKERKPLLSKTLRTNYPPGSVIKPVILIAGLEEKKITPNETISCPAHNAPKGWPNCMQWRVFRGSHDDKWYGQGGNKARNAIRGSCNIYFSVLADRLEPKTLQKWLMKFGFGQRILPGPAFEEQLSFLDRTIETERNLRQSSGKIYSYAWEDPEIMPNIATWDKRMFGIGQGNLQVNVLQVANAIAAIARGGIYKHPRLFLSENDPLNDYQRDLGISKQTMAVVRDGMRAVTSEEGGTAAKTFMVSDLNNRDIKVYGKTGSTEKPYNAWFGGFAEDISGRTLSVAIIVEGGEGGSTDAAPMAEKVLLLFNEAGYLGKVKEKPELSEGH